MRKLLSLILILIVLSGSVSYADGYNYNYGEFYPRLSIVIDIYDNVVVCLDREGNVWEFFTYEGDDSWTVGDICNLLMWNVSENSNEHEIVEVYWEGHIGYEMIEYWVIEKGGE